MTAADQHGPFDLVARVRLLSAIRDTAPEHLTSAEKLVLTMLVSRMNDRGAAWPGVETLASDCSMSQNTIRAATRRLAQKGVLRLERRHKATGVDTSYMYYLGSLPQAGHPSMVEGCITERDGSRIVTRSQTPVTPVTGDVTVAVTRDVADGAPKPTETFAPSALSGEAELQQVASFAASFAAKQVLRAGSLQPLKGHPSTIAGGSLQPLKGESSMVEDELIHRTSPSRTNPKEPQERAGARPSSVITFEGEMPKEAKGEPISEEARQRWERKRIAAVTRIGQDPAAGWNSEEERIAYCKSCGIASEPLAPDADRTGTVATALAKGSSKVAEVRRTSRRFAADGERSAVNAGGRHG